MQTFGGFLLKEIDNIRKVNLQPAYLLLPRMLVISVAWNIPIEPKQFIDFASCKRIKQRRVIVRACIFCFDLWVFYVSGRNPSTIRVNNRQMFLWKFIKKALFWHRWSFLFDRSPFAPSTRNWLKLYHWLLHFEYRIFESQFFPLNLINVLLNLDVLQFALIYFHRLLLLHS